MTREDTSDRRVLVVASTFPASTDDETPAFVRDLVIALKLHDPTSTYIILAPHHQAQTHAYVRHSQFDEYRFSYFYPTRLQCLAGAGILPTISRNYALSLLVPFFVIGEFFALLKLTRRFRPNVIYAHWFTPQGINAAVVSMLTGTPWVLTTHAGDVSILARLPIIGPFIVRRLLPRANAITAVSVRTLNRTRAFFTHDDWEKVEHRTRVIPMGVPMTFHEDTYRKQHSKAERANSSNNVLFLGRLVEKKGVCLLLKAFARARRECDQLTIAGKGPELGALQAAALDLGIHNSVTFVGFVCGKAKLDAFRNADVIVVPSVETKVGDVEGLPVVVLEALAAGKICLASDASGAGDVITNGVNGFLVPQNNIDALTQALRQILTAPRAKLDAISANARASAKAFHWPTVAKMHHEFLFASIDSDES